MSATCQRSRLHQTQMSPVASSISASDPGMVVFRLDAGVPVTALAGVHSGCFELFAHEPIRTISDLKGKKVGIEVLGSGRHRSSAVMAAYVGLDPHKDIDWVDDRPTVRPPWSCSPSGKVDAFLGFPPEPQELRARKIGRVILNTTTDKPWSQYFCCLRVRKQESSSAPILSPPSASAGDPQGKRHLRRRAGAGRATAGRSRVHAALRLRPPDADRAPVRPAGASSTRRIRCASTRCASMRSA